MGRGRWRPYWGNLDSRLAGKSLARRSVLFDRLASSRPSECFDHRVIDIVLLAGAMEECGARTARIDGNILAGVGLGAHRDCGFLEI